MSKKNKITIENNFKEIEEEIINKEDKMENLDIDDELNFDEDDTEIESEDKPKKSYPKRMFGSGTVKATDSRRAQCPICKKFYKRLNETHLKTIHNTTLDELRETHPEYVPYFVIPGYAEQNSDYAKAQAMLNKNNGSEVINDSNDAINSSHDCDHEDSMGSNLNEGPFSVIKDAFEDIIQNLVDQNFIDPNDSNFHDTPKRIKESYDELFSGWVNTDEQINDIIKTSFPAKYDGIVVEDNIETVSVCPHHWLLVTYRIHIGYKSSDRVLGISKLARIAEVLSKRPVMQEQLTTDILNAIMKINPMGAIVVIEGFHSCMSLRGAKQKNSRVTTTALEGCFKYNPDIKAEFMRHIERTKQ